MVYTVDWEECRRKAREPLEKRIAELEAALLAMIRAYDDDNDSPDPEKALSDAVQAARVAYRGGN